MSKKFEEWIAKKSQLHARKMCPHFKERFVYWCALGENIGDEENGKSSKFSRPVLVLKKFNHNLFLGIPLTSKIKKNPYYTDITFKNQKQSALISHIRLFDAKRLYSKMGEMSHGDYQKIMSAIGKFFQ